MYCLGSVYVGLFATVQEGDQTDSSNQRSHTDLVARDAKGEVYTVRYEAVNAMLLNEFLKEHREVQDQKATITQLKSTMAQQQKQIETLTTGLQRVSDQLELNKPAPQIVLNDQ